MNEIIIYSLRKKINNNDIVEKIFNIYIIDKYYNNNLTNTSVKLIKNKYSKDVYYTNNIINTIKPSYSNIYFIKQMLISNEIILKFTDKIPILIKSISYKYKNNKELLLSICKKDNSLIKYASYELKSD